MENWCVKETFAELLEPVTVSGVVNVHEKCPEVGVSVTDVTLQTPLAFGSDAPERVIVSPTLSPEGAVELDAVMDLPVRLMFTVPFVGAPPPAVKSLPASPGRIDM
jgi:hypothetical protein